MLEGLIGKKVGMTQVYSKEGVLIPVTVIQAGPCRVVQEKIPERDGYHAYQVSYEEVSEKKLTKAKVGHFKKANVPMAAILMEFDADPGEFEIGTLISTDIFKSGEWVDVTGVSRGKGFAGVIKRHHFGGGPASHGSTFHRAPGSIGSGSAYPSRVRKGRKLPGHMGAKRVTVQNLKVVESRRDEGLLFIKGAVPGSPGTTLYIRHAKKKK